MRGQLIERGDKTFLLRVYLGRDASKKRRYLNETFYGTVSQAKQRLTALTNAKDEGKVTTPTKKTFKVFLGEWLQAKVDVGPKTKKGYTWLVKAYLGDLSDTKLDKLTALQVQTHYAGMTERGLSPNTIRHFHRVLHHALSDAVQWGFLLRNVTDMVKLPRVERKEMKVLEAAQINVLLDATEDAQLRALWAVLLLGGLRPQEALALKWTDLDVSTLRIQRALVEEDHGYAVSDINKTERSRRAVLLPERVVALLGAHKAQQARVILVAGEGYTRNGFIFATRRGTFLLPGNVNRVWKRTLKLAKLPKLRLYDSRHSHATVLLANGVHPKIVADRLGHSSTRLTLDTYSHVLPTMQQDAVDKLERAMG